MTTVQDIYNSLDADYPFALQEPWDNSGLLCGDASATVTTCLVALDVTAQTILDARELNAELILSHHPIIFSAKKSFTAGVPAYEAARNGISVICAHTNFDKAPRGTNYILSKRLGLITEYHEDLPFRTGYPERPHTVKEMAEMISVKLDADVRYTPGDRTVKKIAVCTGAGGSEIANVAASGANLYITGEMDYHEILDAAAMGLSVITAGHFQTEDPAMEVLAKRLTKIFPDVCFIKHASVPPICAIER